MNRQPKEPPKRRAILAGRDYSIVCTFFLALSLWIGYPGYVNNYYLYRFNGKYAKTKGIITHFYIGHAGPARSDAEKLEMSIAYNVAGKQFECRKLTWGASSPGSMNSYSYLGNLYRSKTPVDVYFDPAYPQNSALLPYINGDDYAYQVGIGFFGVFVLLVFIYPMKKFRATFMLF